jgi:DNA-binding transcriptional regulator GbsR (MarR family)
LEKFKYPEMAVRMSMSTTTTETRERFACLWEKLAGEASPNLIYGRIMGALCLFDQPLSQKELTAKTQFSVSSVSKALDYLVAEGIIWKVKKKGERTYYYAPSMSPREIVVRRLHKMLEAQDEIANEISMLRTELKSSQIREKEVYEAKKSLAILGEFAEAYNRIGKAVAELGQKLLKE